MKGFATLTVRQLATFGGILLGALAVEFIVLESTIGISLPSDRYSAESRGDITVVDLEPHFVTRNHRFTAVQSTGLHPDLMLRELFVEDRAPNLEEPPKATVTVDGMGQNKVRWSFREAGSKGEVRTDNIYQVTKLGCCGGPNKYSYFSLIDGHKIRTSEHELSAAEITGIARMLNGAADD